MKTAAMALVYGLCAMLITGLVMALVCVLIDKVPSVRRAVEWWMWTLDRPVVWLGWTFQVLSRPWPVRVMRLLLWLIVLTIMGIALLEWLTPWRLNMWLGYD